MNNTFKLLRKDDVVFVSSFILSFTAGHLVQNVWFAVLFMFLLHKLELSVDYKTIKNRHWIGLVVSSLLITFIGAVASIEGNNWWIGYLLTLYLYVPLNALIGPIERRPGAVILTVILSVMFVQAGILVEVMN